MTRPDFLFGITPGDVIYDIETYPNCFTLTAKHVKTKRSWVFEISYRRNDIDNLCLFLDTLRLYGCRMVGFNNIGFDYPVIHFIYRNNQFVTFEEIYTKAMSIINAPFQNRFAHMIYESDWIVSQIDLYKVHHFDNPSKSTSLKVLEFNMGMDRVEDLPFDVGINLNNEEIDTLIEYNMHDVNATDMFYDRSQNALTLRENLSETFGRNMMNMSDVKIGQTLLVIEMEKQGVNCYYRDFHGKKKMKQTIRKSLDLADIIFPYVKLETADFNRVHQLLSSQTIVETKGVFDDEMTVFHAGLEYKLGTGGLHASVNGKIVKSTETHQMVDVDVASYYPNLGIKNKLYPAHLGEEFCDAYLNLYKTRKTFKKKTAENEAYKLALNGAYGGSNNQYSPFLDMAYTMSITINGQLLLCMLVEQMLKIPGLTMVQCNTDGITYLCPREHLEHSRKICTWWEGVTQLELEEALYSRMFIRDVNSYIAEYEDGALKRIGAYAYVTAEENTGTRELPWHKNWSSRIVAKAAEAALVHGADIRKYITDHDNLMDFMLRTKVKRSDVLEWGGDKVPNIVRYYISTDGDILEKLAPAKGVAGQFKRANKLTDMFYDSVMDEIGMGVWDERVHTKNKSTYQEVRTGIHTGWTVRICNDIQGHAFEDINYDYYIKETEKLVLCMEG